MPLFSFYGTLSPSTTLLTYLILQTRGLAFDTADDNVRSIFRNNFIIVEHFKFYNYLKEKTISHLSRALETVKGGSHLLMRPYPYG
jgi:hypothetical protein